MSWIPYSILCVFLSRCSWSQPQEHLLEPLLPFVFQDCSIFQIDHYMWSIVYVIVFIHPHTPSKLSRADGNMLRNHQMLCSSATVIVTGLWFVEHLFSHLASVFLSLCESFLFYAVNTLPTLSCDYSRPAIIWQFVSQSLQSSLMMAEAASRCYFVVDVGSSLKFELRMICKVQTVQKVHISNMSRTNVFWLQ